MTILTTILAAVPMRATQRRFLRVLLQTWQAIPGRINAANLARYSGLSEQTFRNGLSKTLPWPALHTVLIEVLCRQGLIGSTFLLGIDASFVAKSGAKTAGTGSFWHGCHARAERGLELSCCTLIDTRDRQAFPVNVRQTQPKQDQADRLTQYGDHLRASLDALPPGLRASIKAIVADGQYAKTLFMQEADAQNLPLVSKLQSNANLRYLYSGAHPKRRGPRQKYAGKVDFEDFARWTLVSSNVKERVYTCVEGAPHFQRDLRVVVVQRLNKRGQVIQTPINVVT